jgi:hypothetical protein
MKLHVFDENTYFTNHVLNFVDCFAEFRESWSHHADQWTLRTNDTGKLQVCCCTLIYPCSQNLFHGCRRNNSRIRGLPFLEAVLRSLDFHFCPSFAAMLAPRRGWTCSISHRTPSRSCWARMMRAHTIGRACRKRAWRRSPAISSSLCKRCRRCHRNQRYIGKACIISATAILTVILLYD